MARSIAKIAGIALKSGAISANGRLYEPHAVASAVRRAQERIADGSKPLTMLTHHDANDSSLHIVGRITGMSLDPEGNARYEAEIADTEHGRTIASLIDTSDGEPFLKGVSIRGAWLGPVKRKNVDGQQVEYGEGGLELDGIDLTKSPGVTGAGIDQVQLTPSGKPRETSDGRTLIFESVVEATIITEDAPAESEKTAETVTYADPGYLPDGKPRLPVSTREGLRAAWSAVREATTDTTYTDKQRRRIRERVGKAAVKLGYDVTPTGWLVSPTVTESDVWPDRPGSYCINVDNGMVSISVASYQVDPVDLEVAARAAMEGAVAALIAIDPDMDGDIDADDSDSSETSPDDDATESAPTAALDEQAPSTSPPADTPSAATATQKETGMAESTTPAAGVPAESAPVENVAAPAVAPVVTFSSDQFAQLLGALAPRELATAGAPAESAPTAPVIEAAPVEPVAVTESADEKIARLVAEGIKAALPAAVQEHVEANGVQRKGLVQEHSAPAAGASSEFPEYWPRDDAGQPKAVLSDSELDAVTKRMLPGAVLGNR